MPSAHVTTLSAANTYTGTTVVSNGTLLVNGSLAGAASVANGATLGGAGTIGGSLTVNSGARLAPGSGAIGTLTVGGNITLYTELCETARQEAFDIMRQHGAELGANAIVAMRYDANEVAQGVTEVLAYGTAVVVEPLAG